MLAAPSPRLPSRLSRPDSGFVPHVGGPLAIIAAHVGRQTASATVTRVGLFFNTTALQLRHVIAGILSLFEQLQVVWFSGSGIAAAMERSVPSSNSMKRWWSVT